jgi:hypothetical protein
LTEALRAVRNWERTARPVAASVAAYLSLFSSVAYGLGLVLPPPPGAVAAAAFFGVAGALFSIADRLSR